MGYNRIKRILNEAIVANPDDIDEWLETFIDHVTLEVGKRWIATKARKHLFNTEDLLRQVDGTSVYSYIGTIPPYIQSAFETDSPVFALDKQNQNLINFSTDLLHIVDYFNSLQHAATVQPGQWGVNHPNVVKEKRMRERALAIINKLEQTAFKDIRAQSEKWYQFVAANRDLSQKQEGVDIIKDWGTHYAVTYKNSQALELDGGDLANCLRYSYYENRIQSGEAKVITIREKSRSGDPTRDKAVVAISLLSKASEEVAGRWEVNECKGYGNRVPAIQYHKMITELLNDLDNLLHIVLRGVSNDLKAMGISAKVIEGKTVYGSFEDVAEVIYDQDGIRIIASDSRAEIGIGRVGLSLGLRHGFIVSIDGDINHVGIDNTIKALNILKTPTVNNSLEKRLKNEYGIVSEKKYYTDRMEAIFKNLLGPESLVYETNTLKVYEGGHSYVVIKGDKKLSANYVQHQDLTNDNPGPKMLVPRENFYRLDELEPDEFIDFMNATKTGLIGCDFSHYDDQFVDFLMRNRIWTDETKVGYMEDVCETFITENLTTYIGKVLPDGQTIFTYLNPMDADGPRRSLHAKFAFRDNNFEIWTGEFIDSYPTDYIQIMNKVGIEASEKIKDTLLSELDIIYQDGTFIDLNQIEPVFTTSKANSFFYKDYGNGAYVYRTLDKKLYTYLYLRGNEIRVINHGYKSHYPKPINQYPELTDHVAYVLGSNKKYFLGKDTLEELEAIIIPPDTYYFTIDDIIKDIKAERLSDLNHYLENHSTITIREMVARGTEVQQFQLLEAISLYSKTFRIMDEQRKPTGTMIVIMPNTTWVKLFHNVKNDAIQTEVLEMKKTVRDDIERYVKTLPNPFLVLGGNVIPLLTRLVKKINDGEDKE